MGFSLKSLNPVKAAEKIGKQVNKKVGKAVHKAGKSVLKEATSVANRANKVALQAAGRAVKEAEKAVKKTVNKATQTAVDLAKKAEDSTKILSQGVEEVFKLGQLNPMVATSISLGKSITRGESLKDAAEAAVKAGVKSVKKGLKYAEMVAPFVPGIGSGAAAALGAAGALANGKPITEAMLSAARSAIPGGAIAKEAFDVGLGLAQGKDITSIALEAAREHIPGGKEAKMAFDAATALGRGKSLQQGLIKAGKHAVSEFAADSSEFIRALKADTNIQSAALSKAGRAVFQRSKRAAEIDGKADASKRIDTLVRKKQHAIRVPKSVVTAVKGIAGGVAARPSGRRSPSAGAGNSARRRDHRRPR